jgi:drug/metabolite transporter (DMT)-like permease
VLSILLAFLGHSLHNIAQAGQKIALSTIPRRPVGGKLLWLGITVFTSASFLIVLAAISLGSVATVGAMAGTGLASLAVFSHFVMGEHLTWKHIVAIGGIIAGAALVGFFMGTPRFVAHRALLYWVLLGGVVLYVALWIALGKRSIQGVAIGSFAGFLGAYSQLFQKLGTSELDLRAGIGPFALAVLRDPITLIWVGLSVVSMVILQFAYGHGKAIQIIPSYTSTFIVVPVLGGVVMFGESLAVMQWVGVLLIASGAVLLSVVEELQRPVPLDLAQVGAGRAATKHAEVVSG